MDELSEKATDDPSFTLQARIRRLEKLLSNYGAELRDKQNETTAKTKELHTLTALVEQSRQEFETLAGRLRAVESAYERDRAALARLDDVRRTLRTGSEESEPRSLSEAADLLISKLQRLAQIEGELAGAKEYIASLEAAMVDKEAKLRHLHTTSSEALSRLAVVDHSIAFGLVVKPVWKLRRMILPDGSRRADFYFRSRRRLRNLLNPVTAAVVAHVEIQEPVRSAVIELPPPPAAARPTVKSIAPAPLDISAGSTAIFTIVSKNYLSYARVLMQSIRAVHPDLPLVVVLVGEIAGDFDPADEPFQLLLASDLGIPRWRHFSLKYDIMELNTAVKPYAIRLLMEKYAADRVLYFDPDIYVQQRLDTIFELLDDHLCILTPHITAPLDDSFLPSEIDFLRVGTYNLGFFAISRTGEWERLVGWWEKRLYEECTREVDRGLFVDQHWMDLVPSLFAPVHILRDPGYNVAYWNLASRELAMDAAGNYSVNGRPLVFFHFSGFSVAHPEIVSKHQNRFTFEDLNPATRRYFSEYRQRLLDCGFEKTSKLQYALGRFSDGLPVTDTMRICLRRNDSAGKTWPDAFALDGAASFREWALTPGAIAPFRYLSPYALTIYQQRPDIQAVFPDVADTDERAYAEWFVAQAGLAEEFPQAYVEPIRQALGAAAVRSLLAVPHSPASRNGRPSRLASAIRYYREYPVKVKPYLPKYVLTEPSTVFTGPTNAYGKVRGVLKRTGMLRTVRRLVGPRLVLTARHFFSPQPYISTSVNVIRSVTPPAAGEPDPEPDAEEPRQPLEYGATIIGYLRAETGVGQIARNLIKCLEASDFPVAGQLLDSGVVYRQSDDSVGHLTTNANHFVNIFNVNADQALSTYRSLGPTLYEHHYNIGYWFWELSKFPEDWDDAFEIYDEIWTATRFVQEAIQAKTTKPVNRVPVSIEVPLPEESSRAQFGLSESSFIVLFNFDALSVVERKNPWAVIRAFEQAFTPQERISAARLVLKTSNLDRVPERDRLQAELEGVNGIQIDWYMDRTTVNALTSHCDVYISLHRSEGYGLTIAEAMYLGKPTIATAYSGNVDFMNDDISYLVPYRLVELGRDYFPYDKTSVWAEPDVEAAASYLREIYEHRDEAKAKGQRAARYIREQFNVKRVGAQIAGRLNAVLAEHDVSRTGRR